MNCHQPTQDRNVLLQVMAYILLMILEPYGLVLHLLVSAYAYWFITYDEKSYLHRCVLSVWKAVLKKYCHTDKLVNSLYHAVAHWKCSTSIWQPVVSCTYLWCSVAGGQDLWSARDLVLRPPVHRQQRLHHMAEAEQKGKLQFVFLLCIVSCYDHLSLGLCLHLLSNLP